MKDKVANFVNKVNLLNIREGLFEEVKKKGNIKTRANFERAYAYGLIRFFLELNGENQPADSLGFKDWRENFKLNN